MKRSEINKAYRKASAFFAENCWTLPPNPRWDITDFGLGNFKKYGLVLINLAEEPEYCEKLMYAEAGQTTPMHMHKIKKEDIIVRTGRMQFILWYGLPDKSRSGEPFTINRNNMKVEVQNGKPLILEAGERITLTPGVYHEFAPISSQCIIGEVSTANDDLHDNFFINKDIGRFSAIEEDEPALITLLSD